MIAREPSAKNAAQLRRLAQRSVAMPHAVLPPLPNSRYDIVYLDPPWYYYGSAIKDAAAGKHYPLMTVDQLANIDVRKILSKDAAVFMWATCPRLDFALKLIEAWGLTYRGVAYVWVKTNRRGEIISGQGVPPTFTKPTTELVLAATTKPTGRPFPILDLAQPQVVLHSRGAHSEKPEIFRRRIEQLCGDRPRIELFARSSAAGWDSWGAEVGKLDRARGHESGPRDVGGKGR
ncbi:MAG: MT-A70 family methyltransferase [Candidatus Cybelea sp.]|jgi:site-specific DNA-methyltransferase (adenine-specific)